MKGTMTIRQVANVLGVTKEAIRLRVRDTLHKKTIPGQTIRLNEAEVSLIADAMREHPSNNLQEAAKLNLSVSTTVFDSTINLAKAIKYLRKVDTVLTSEQSKELIAWVLTKSDYDNPYIKQLNSFNLLLDTEAKAKELSKEFESKVTEVFKEVYGTLLDRIE